MQLSRSYSICSGVGIRILWTLPILGKLFQARTDHSALRWSQLQRSEWRDWPKSTFRFNVDLNDLVRMEARLLSRSPHPAATDDILDSTYCNTKQHAALKGSELMRTRAVGRVDLHTVVYLQNPNGHLSTMAEVALYEREDPDINHSIKWVQARRRLNWNEVLSVNPSSCRLWSRFQSEPWKMVLSFVRTNSKMEKQAAFNFVLYISENGQGCVGAFEWCPNRSHCKLGLNWEEQNTPDLRCHEWS